MGAEDARECRGDIGIESHLQCADIIGEHDVGGCDDRVGVDCGGRAPSAGAVRGDNGVDHAEMDRRRAEQCGDHVARMPAFPIVQVLVDQRQNADQRVEAQCVSGHFVGAALAEYDPHVGIEPVA